jgi:hypothetical protein
MTDLTRRQALKLAASAPVAALYPMAAEAAATVPSLATLYDSVSKETATFRNMEAPPLLDGTYAKLFTQVPSTMAYETVVHTRYNSGRGTEIEQQRFAFSFEHEDIGWHFRVVTDDDPREAIDGSRPVRMAGLKQGLIDLTQRIAMHREQDAARIFNKADTYDATIGGDGVALCSLKHPHDEGVWANTFATQSDLNGVSLAAALDHIQSNYVDQAGIRIFVRGRQLVVAPADAEAAQRALTALGTHQYREMQRKPIVWPYLERRDNWFVVTSVPRLAWFERMPFTISCELDTVTNSVLVVGDERRKFGATDPRAIFGSLPS